MTNKYEFTPMISIKPNKIAYYTKVDNVLNKELRAHGHSIETYRKQPEKRFHNFQLSSNARRNLISKINWMFQLAKKKSVTTSKGVDIFNFKIAFITLTLPSTQLHPTTQITNECLNQFITEIRERFGVLNYVWRLEFQKNYNVHYHIVTDTYIDYEILKNIWNRILNKLGYVNEYTRKMQAHTLHSYYSSFYKDSNKTFKEVAKIYAKSKSEGWARPNSVDVKSCTTQKKISLYIAKYFAKSSDEINPCNPLDTEENSFGLRLWFCSRSLSKLKSITMETYDLSVKLDEYLEQFQDTCRFVNEYCRLYFFNFTSLCNEGKRLLGETFTWYRDMCGYIPAS